MRQDHGPHKVRHYYAVLIKGRWGTVVDCRSPDQDGRDLWGSAGIDRGLRGSAGICGDLWGSMGDCRDLRGTAGIYGGLQGSAGVCGGLRGSVGIGGDWWESVGICRGLVGICRYLQTSMGISRHPSGLVEIDRMIFTREFFYKLAARTA